MVRLEACACNLSAKVFFLDKMEKNSMGGIRSLGH